MTRRPPRACRCASHSRREAPSLRLPRTPTVQQHQLQRLQGCSVTCCRPHRKQGELASGNGTWRRLQVSVATLWASCCPRLVRARSLREEAPRWGPPFTHLSFHALGRCAQTVLSPGVWLSSCGGWGWGASEVSEVRLGWMAIL